MLDAGGSVSADRVSGSLAVSRAFGDIDSEGRKPVGLSADPELHAFELGADFEFIMVACDGCWELGPSEALGREARRLLRAKGCVQTAAEEVVRGLLDSKGATDNLTLLLVAQQRISERTGKPYFSVEPKIRKFSSFPQLMGPKRGLGRCGSGKLALGLGRLGL